MHIDDNTLALGEYLIGAVTAVLIVWFLSRW